MAHSRQPAWWCWHPDDRQVDALAATRRSSKQIDPLGKSLGFSSSTPCAKYFG
jgi:hypothetical protein